MAKTIKVSTASYNVMADVVINAVDGVHIEKFDCGGFDSKNVRTLKKQIADQMIDDIIGNYGKDAFIICITNITTDKIVSTVTYKINASNAEIINACREYGLTVEDVNDSVSDESDTDEDETA